jgi:hypothetical protein
MDIRRKELFSLSLVLGGALLAWGAWLQLSKDVRAIGVDNVGNIVSDSLDPWMLPLLYFGSSLVLVGVDFYIYFRFFKQTH